MDHHFSCLTDVFRVSLAGGIKNNFMKVFERREKSLSLSFRWIVFTPGTSFLHFILSKSK